MENKNDLLENFQTLQNLKFEVYKQSNNLDYHQIGILKLHLPQQTVDLSKVYGKYKKELSITDIAALIVHKYDL